MTEGTQLRHEQSMPRAIQPVLLAFLVLFLVSSTAPAQTANLTIRDIGRFSFVGGENGDPHQVAEGLSGFVRFNEDRYLAVSDLHAFIHRLTIEVDVRTGEILNARFDGPLRLTDTLGIPFPEPEQAMDREGIVYDPATKTVWIANEQAGADTTMPSISQHSWTTGRMTEVLVADCDGPLHAFCNMRTNQGFESLTRSPDGEAIWTANEQSLTIDGGVPTTSQGAVVRLQRFDGSMQPIAQYAYVTAPLSESTPPRIAEWSISGLVELLALPGGALLALERAVVGGPAGDPIVRIRIYQVHVQGATDISREPWATGLLAATDPYSTVQKGLLIELSGRTGRESNFNYEGMAFGPRLENGDRSLILIADNAEGTDQSLYALRLSGTGSSQ